MRQLNRTLRGGAVLGVASALVLAAACGGDSKETDGELPGKAGSSASGGSSATGGSSAAGGSSATGGTGGSIGMGARGGSAGSISVEPMGGAGGEQSCGSSALEAAPPKVNVLLVVDKSSSMAGTDEFSEGRWTALGEALGTALAAAEERVAFGLDFFPAADDPEATPSTCQTPSGSEVLVPIDDGPESVPLIVDALEEHAPAGGTPTAAALARALEYFTTGEGQELEGKKYVLLATDGGPNCNPDLSCDEDACTINLENEMASMGCGGSCCDPDLDPNGGLNCLDEDGTLEQVEALADEGIGTFVVGIPGSQFFADTLNRLADAGLVPNPDAPPSYYQVSADAGAEGLADVLTSITTGLITTCRLQLTSTPPDPDYEGLLNVEIDGREVPQAGEDGWDVDRETSPPTIVVKGATCEFMETEGATSVTITYGCPTVVVPR